ncbi:Oidioi.mRNA.OKI2018_I69.PAR.g10897.t1.cds [Oikopleura dioica]|uniref:Oidioi.mRNA.OKI2018_I69.PAR.g10897.t1.cds n=1 Tax=Oikopleura dioica TaxID=34765 RepID=A0ABN7RSZ4_OIKDI|nr:Oidioi.mRNA.OKI2018_I69.PAR.g10897.t1.cds [Oikopleura dioica]
MIDMSSEDEDYSEILSPIGEKCMVGENYRFLANSIFDFNREKSREMTVERSKWIATAKGLSIALLGAGVGYGCQSVFVNQLAQQDPPINAMESLFFRSAFQTGVNSVLHKHVNSWLQLS